KRVADVSQGTALSSLWWFGTAAALPMEHLPETGENLSRTEQFRTLRVVEILLDLGLSEDPADLRYKGWQLRGPLGILVGYLDEVEELVPNQVVQGCLQPKTLAEALTRRASFNPHFVDGVDEWLRRMTHSKNFFLWSHCVCDGCIPLWKAAK